MVSSSEFQALSRRFLKAQVIHEQLKAELVRLEKAAQDAQARMMLLKKASIVLQRCSSKVREAMAASIDEIVTWALRLVLNAEWTFKIDFVQRRSQWECEFLLVDPEGKESDLKNGSGGGVVDIASLSLFIIFAALFNRRSGLPIFLDEPLRNLSTEEDGIAERAVMFLRGITDRLKLQIVLLTHQSPLVEAADRAYYFQLVDGACQVTDVTTSRPVYSTT